MGAGPAGSALARRLRPGCRVLLLERPQAEAAGGATHRRVLAGRGARALRRLGMYDRFLAQGHVERGALVSQWDLDTPTWFDPVRDPHETDGTWIARVSMQA
ncbi:FAD-dependent oxidoreductase [Duganella radicis]|uniref:FAD-dependent oxidoreductase n=1 Tax=Duganella radicis TaxID=551988 RepID=UPI003530A5AD